MSIFWSLLGKFAFREIDTDIIGVRRAVCLGGDRNGTVQPDLILAMRQAIDDAGQDRAGRPVAAI